MTLRVEIVGVKENVKKKLAMSSLTCGKYGR